jgi:hypothetical protein
MSYVLETKNYKGYEIKVVSDNTPDSPRNWDNLGTMVCFHRGYDLGDSHNYKKTDYNSWSELKEAIIKKEDVAVILPLYLYDHSGITMNTTGFDCRWDSGQIGFIFISKEKIRKEYGIKRVTQKWKDRIKQYLIGEVETYDTYIRGEVVGYQVWKDGNIEDSCYGYYSTEDAMSEAESIVDCSIKNTINEHISRVKKWIKSKVPQQYRIALSL